MSRFRVALSKPDGTPAFPTFDPGPFEDDPDVAIFHGRTIDNVEACTDNAIAVAITPDDVRRPVAVSVLTFILWPANSLSRIACPTPDPTAGHSAATTLVSNKFLSPNLSILRLRHSFPVSDGVDAPPDGITMCQGGGVINATTKEEASMEQVVIIGIDLAKHSFQLHGALTDGSVAFRKKLSRGKLLRFLALQPRCVVAMEACASAHHWGREFAELGHDVKLIPPIYVKPFVKRQKNDAADVEAICEAAQRPTMSFVTVKTAEQQARGMLLRTRDLLVRQRTQTINALRGHLAEFGIVAPQGPAQTAASPGMSDGTPFLRIAADRIGAPGSARIAGNNAIPRHQRRQLVLNHPDRREDGCHSKANCASSGFASHSTGWEGSIWGIPVDIGLVDAPTPRLRPAPLPAQTFLHLRCEPLHPAIDRGAVDRDAALGHHRFEVAVVDCVAAVPANRPEHDLPPEVTSLEIVHASTPLRVPQTVQQPGKLLQQSQKKR